MTTTANVDASYINGNVVTSNLMVSGEYTMGGRIIPDTNDAYDIGSAEKKIRDLYVADNSLWIGDETKISFASGKMRFRKRKKNVVPAAILAAGGTATAAKTFSSKANLNDIKSHEWLKYMKTLGGKGNAIMSDVFRNNDDDYEATTAAEAWKDINDDIFSESNVSIGKTSSPTVTLDVEGDGKFSGNVVTTGNIGIRTATPSANLHVMGYQYVNGPPTLANAFDHSDAPLTLTHDTATSSTAINDPKPLLHLTRSGTNNESYGARASFNLSRYENSSTHSRSRLDVALADGTYAESTVMTLRADGKVGVGTDTPAYTLDVAGDINLSGDFYQGGSPFVSSLWTDGTDSLYYRSNVEVGTANLFVDTTTSNVGIGTSTPAYTLDVAGDINLSGDFYQGGSPFVSSLWTENVGKLYYNGGNVGIGTTSPGYKLDVHGSANVGALTVTSVTGLEAADIPNLDASKITTGTLNNARLPTSINVTNVSGNGSGLTSLNADNISSGTLNNARLPTSINVTNVSGDGSGLTSLNADNISSGTLNNARLTDASTTVKGIVQLSSSTSGTSTTKAATESAVKAAYDRNSWGSGSFSSDVNITGGSFRVGNSNGTSQPQFFVKNEVNATDTDENDRALLQLKAGDSDHNGFLMDLDDDDTYSENGNNEFVFKIRTKDNAIADAADADTKFVIRPSGRILVNYGSTYKLTNPSDPYLAVNGDISSSGTITATSSVGIGTTSPGYKLDVHGSANVGALTATTISGPFSGNASTATALETARNINGVSFDGSANITVNGLNYDVNGVWLREQGDNTNFKQYGNSRQMVFRTDGTTQYASGVGAYPFVWMYGGDAASNRRMFLNTSGQLWCSNYGWLHDKFMARTQVFTDNVANTTFSGQTIDHNCSGSDACTTDRVHRALFIDMDSSATGGDTNHEHRMYGIYSDVRHSGDSDLVYGMYSYTRSDHTSGTTTNLRAGDFTAQASGTGINTNIYGLNSYAIKDGGSTGTTTNMFGVRGEVEVDAGTCTNAYAFQSHIDRDGGTITNGYLYYGSYSGTVGTKWGVYVTGETKNYFSGNVGIGTTSPGYKLDVGGTLHAANSYFDNVYIGGSTSRGLRSVSGHYGTVQTTGGGAGGWEGYSIDGRYVFMSADNNRCGIYNDLDNEWMIYCYRNSYVKLYYNGGEKLETLGGGVKIHGSLTATGNVTAYSDIRHKKDIVKLDNALEKVEKLNGYTYTRKDDDKRYTGLIAQEVLEVLPEAVIADEKGEYSLAYGNMAGLFVEAMKEMKSKLDTALARLDALENPPS